MSFSFYMKTPSAPDFFETVDAASSDLDCEEFDYDFYPHDGGPFPQETFFHFYIHGVSTRSLEMGYDDRGYFQVRIMTCSCAEEYEAAFEIVKQVAKKYAVKIEPEDRDPISLSEFDTQFDDAWVAEMVTSGATFLPAMIKDEAMASPLTLPGPVRDFHIGPRLLKELEADPRDFTEALFDCIRRTRYVDPEEYWYHANQMAISAPDSEHQSTIAAWGPGVDYIFPKVDYFAFIDEDTFLVPWEIVLEKVEVEYLDECQFKAKAIPDAAWEDFLNGVRPHAVDLADA